VEAFDRRDLLVRGVAAAALLAAPRLAAPPRHLRELRRGLAGDVLTGASAGYEQARLLYSPRFDSIRPQAIVYCETVADVVHTIHWARRYGIHLVVRSGGHSYGGYSTSPGVVLDVSRLNRVHVAGRQVTVGAGTLLIDVYSALAAHGSAIPAGSGPSVGIAGLTLGGGHGYASRKLGLTCDTLLGLTIVTAAGDVLRCDRRRHPDLFWACRGGGGGNFGVVTSFTFRTTPVAEVSTYFLEWPWAQARNVVAAWQAFASHAPDALSLVCNLTATDRRPGSRLHVTSAGQFLGSAADLQTALAPLLSVGTPTHVEIKPRTLLEAALHFAGCDRRTVAQCRRRDKFKQGTVQRETWKAKSDYVKRPLPKTAIDTMVEAMEARQDDATLGHGTILLDAYGGAIGRVPKAATAFVHRGALFSAQYLAFWPSGDRARATRNLTWMRSFYASLRPYVSGEAYVNYIDPELRGWARAYYGANLPRLRRVKRRYDPANFFRFAQSIRQRT
jgi:FAD/FMN-containing dehydrogenase